MPRILFELSLGINPVFFGNPFNLSHVVRMLCRIGCAAIRPEGVYATQRVLKQYPHLFFRTYVRGIVSLDIGEPVTRQIFNEDIVVRRVSIELTGNDAILNGDCPSIPFGKATQFESSFCQYPGIIDVRRTFDLTIVDCVVCQKLRCVIRDRL